MIPRGGDDAAWHRAALNRGTSALLNLERNLVSELAASTAGDPAIGAFPIIALWVEPTDD
jgi:hypothetical protein